VGTAPATGRYVGVADDVRDFPFGQVLGLSSYPFLGGFANPEDVPLDYYQRLSAESKLPVMVVEGGWSSGSVPAVVSSAERQGRSRRSPNGIAPCRDRCATDLYSCLGSPDSAGTIDSPRRRSATSMKSAERAARSALPSRNSAASRSTRARRSA
jgi:hypothetical protein